MRAFTQKKSQSQQPASLNLSKSRNATSKVSTLPTAMHHLQPAIENQTAQSLPRMKTEDIEMNSQVNRAIPFGYDFSRIPIYSVPRNVLQTKLAINEVGDIYEQEADRVAQQIMRLPESQHYAPERLQPKRIQVDDSSKTIVPPIIHEALHSSGQPLDPITKEFMESRFGHDFSQVRVHADALASDAASTIAARAFTVNRDIVFGKSEYAPQTESGRRLLSHELTHTLQQDGQFEQKSLQKTPCIDERGTGPFNVSVIGAPGPGEIKASHPYQFMNAALYKGVDKNTVWIVEKTGYEAGKVDTGYIETSVAPGCLIWLTPTTQLSSIISKEFPSASIASMSIYSHGIPGSVTLRYGWESQGLPNYGLSMDQVKSFSNSKFALNSTIDFNSCNTGTSANEGNLAQEMAYYTGQQVRAWTGRTSYAEVNDREADKDTGVHGSEVYRNNLDYNEIISRIKGRTPKFTTFSPPKTRTGGFSSDFEITTRLPETTHFDVPEGGMVVVTCFNGTYLRPDRDPNDLDRVGIYLWKSDDLVINSGYESLKVKTRDIAVFRNLQAGNYYLEIIAESKPVADYETLSSDIIVDVYDA